MIQFNHSLTRYNFQSESSQYFLALIFKYEMTIKGNQIEVWVQNDVSFNKN